MQNNIQNISDGSMISAITATSVTDRQDGALEEDGMLFFFAVGGRSHLRRRKMCASVAMQCMGQGFCAWVLH
jgi:hypothetical protein